MSNWNDYHDGYRAGLEKANEIALDLENRWRRSAARIRQDGTYKTMWPFRRTRVAGGYEKAARDIEAAADGIKAIRAVVLNQKPVRELKDADAYDQA